MFGVLVCVASVAWIPVFSDGDGSCNQKNGSQGIYSITFPISSQYHPHNLLCHCNVTISDIGNLIFFSCYFLWTRDPKTTALQLL